MYGSDIVRSASSIQSNGAKSNGGFLSCYNATIEISKHNFINNNAQYGGAFFIKSSILTIIGRDNESVQNEISNNKATIDGGFICAYNDSFIEIEYYLFLNNTVTSIGGGGNAFLVQDSSLTMKVHNDPAKPTTFEIEGNNINML